LGGVRYEWGCIGLRASNVYDSNELRRYMHMDENDMGEVNIAMRIAIFLFMIGIVTMMLNSSKFRTDRHQQTVTKTLDEVEEAK
jgi:hypothetical protein